MMGKQNSSSKLFYYGFNIIMLNYTYIGSIINKLSLYEAESSTKFVQKGAHYKAKRLVR